MVRVSEWQGKQIQKYRRQLEPKMTQEDLGRRVGKSRAMIARYETGLDDPPLPVLEKMSKELRVPVQSLIEPENPPIKTGKTGVLYEGESSEPDYAEIPYWGEVPAGDWQLPQGDDTAMMRVEKGLAKPNRRSVRIAGDSMVPRLQHGDIVHIELSKTPREGVITLARNQDSELTLKLLKHNLGQWELQSFNPEFSNPTAQQWEILGYAVVIERHLGPGRYTREVDELGLRANSG